MHNRGISASFQPHPERLTFKWEKSIRFMVGSRFTRRMVHTVDYPVENEFIIYGNLYPSLSRM